MKRTLLLAAVVATGCSRYAWVPASPPTHTVPAFNRDAAYYAIPESHPQGDLRVVSYGVETLAAGDPDAPSDGDVEIRALHLRVTIESTGDQRWTFDTREQRVELDGVGAESPAFAVSDHAGDGSVPPVVRFGFGVMRIVDLFYTLPPDLDAKRIPAFRAVTTVHTGDGDVVEATPFERIEVGLLSPYAQDDVVAEGGYDWTSETFWTNDGAPHARRGRIYARPRAGGGGSSSRGGVRTVHRSSGGSRSHRR